jgi:8-oxo-dGTP diphosphatase
MYHDLVKGRNGIADNWADVPVFGKQPEGPAWVIRESAYLLGMRDDGCLAVVRSSQGTFLPGGGIESGETPQEAIIREALEECGLIIQPGAWVVRAIQFVYAEQEKTHFEKRSIFLDGVIVGFDSTCREPDHELVWAKTEEATRILSHESQRWAVKQWQAGKLSQPKWEGTKL